MINENRLIQNLEVKSRGFIGDDAAILPALTGEKYVISTDLLVENIHFRTHYFTPYDLAHKALHVNLSDLAAMGAKPLYILCGISIPKKHEQYANDFLNFLTKICETLDIILIGGDTTASSGDLFISITAIGQANKYDIKRRKTAKRDDLICVAGNLGWAHIGFTALEKNLNIDTQYIASFLRPVAKIEEGIWLAQQNSVSSMMDISDGLYIDLKRLCHASLKGAIIDLDKLSQYQESELTLQIMLEGGEDYGLLFTVRKELYSHLLKAFSRIFKYELKWIGYINASQKIQFLQGGKYIDLNISPYTHFGEGE